MNTFSLNSIPFQLECLCYFSFSLFPHQNKIFIHLSRNIYRVHFICTTLEDMMTISKEASYTWLSELCLPDSTPTLKNN
jgi:hypothetical protein